VGLLRLAVVVGHFRLVFGRVALPVSVRSLVERLSRDGPDLRRLLVLRVVVTMGSSLVAGDLIL